MNNLIDRDRSIRIFYHLKLVFNSLLFLRSFWKWISLNEIQSDCFNINFVQTILKGLSEQISIVTNEGSSVTFPSHTRGNNNLTFWAKGSNLLGFVLSCSKISFQSLRKAVNVCSFGSYFILNAEFILLAYVNIRLWEFEHIITNWSTLLQISYLCGQHESLWIFPPTLKVSRIGVIWTQIDWFDVQNLPFGDDDSAGIGKVPVQHRHAEINDQVLLQPHNFSQNKETLNMSFWAQKPFSASVARHLQLWPDS